MRMIAPGGVLTIVLANLAVSCASAAHADPPPKANAQRNESSWEWRRR